MNKQEYSKQLTKVREHLVNYTQTLKPEADRGSIRLMYSIITQAAYDLRHGNDKESTSASDYFKSASFSDLCSLLCIKTPTMLSIVVDVDKYNVAELSENEDDESYF